MWYTFGTQVGATHNRASTFTLVQDRLECSESHTVRYNSSRSSLLSLQIPLEAATNTTEVEEYQAAKRARIEDGESCDPNSTWTDSIVRGIQERR